MTFAKKKEKSGKVERTDNKYFRTHKVWIPLGYNPVGGFAKIGGQVGCERREQFLFPSLGGGRRQRRRDAR